MREKTPVPCKRDRERGREMILWSLNPKLEHMCFQIRRVEFLARERERTEDSSRSWVNVKKVDDEERWKR